MLEIPGIGAFYGEPKIEVEDIAAVDYYTLPCTYHPPPSSFNHDGGP
jgi:hypothetical protein